MPLKTTPNFHTPGELQRHAHESGDAFYAALVAAHAGLTDAQSEQLNARLVLLLANHIGDRNVLDEAIALARHALLPPP
jgi:Protein of unknown function (DUF2783)